MTPTHVDAMHAAFDEWLAIRRSYFQRRLSESESRIMRARVQAKAPDEQSRGEEWWLGTFGTGHGSKTGTTRLDGPPEQMTDQRLTSKGRG